VQALNTTMEKIITFIKNSWEEITQHVTWPTWSDLQGSSTLVLVASLLFALVVGLIDFGIENGLKLYYESF
jgi:preprotein translocase subunit SecE